MHVPSLKFTRKGKGRPALVKAFLACSYKSGHCICDCFIIAISPCSSYNTSSKGYLTEFLARFWMTCHFHEVKMVFYYTWNSVILPAIFSTGPELTHLFTISIIILFLVCHFLRQSISKQCPFFKLALASQYLIHHCYTHRLL